MNYQEWPENYPMPPVVLIVSAEMKNNFNHFGDAVSFDITYKTCNYYVEVADDKGVKKPIHWNLGVFSVFIEDCRPVVCGMCFILR